MSELVCRVFMCVGYNFFNHKDFPPDAKGSRKAHIEL